MDVLRKGILYYNRSKLAGRKERRERSVRAGNVHLHRNRGRKNNGEQKLYHLQPKGNECRRIRESKEKLLADRECTALSFGHYL